MKFLISISLIIYSLSAWAQETEKPNVVTPKIVQTIHSGKSTHYNDVSIKLVKILNDSRCPKNVSCVWAGEATVLVDVFKNEKKIGQKKVVFNHSSRQDNALRVIFSSETLTITAIDLAPYPIAGKKIEMKDYYLQLDIEE